MRSTVWSALASAVLVLGCAESPATSKPTVVDLPIDSPVTVTSAAVDNAEPPPKAAATAAEPPGGFSCSMHPQIREAAAGTCPICGMDLIEVPTKQ